MPVPPLYVGWVWRGRKLVSLVYRLRRPVLGELYKTTPKVPLLHLNLIEMVKSYTLRSCFYEMRLTVLGGRCECILHVGGMGCDLWWMLGRLYFPMMGTLI